MANTKRERLLKNIETATFLLIWVMVFVSPIIAQNNNESTEWSPIIASWFRLSPFLIMSAVNHFLLVPQLFFKNRKALYMLSVVVLVATFIAFNDPFQKKIIRKEHSIARKEYRLENQRKSKNDYRSTSDKNKAQNRKKRSYIKRHLTGVLPPKLSLIIVSLLVLGFDLGLSTIFKWSQSEQERTKLEKEHLDTQLAFLRNQISPHFFMNTLNNIHSLIDINTNEAKAAVIQLSKLMRHLLYDSEADKIPLQKEIDFINHFIELMRLRYTNKVDIQFMVETSIPDCNIPPLLFTSFLENAFKHGVSYQEQSFIHAKMASSNNKLHFSIRNSNPKNIQTSDASGIGLANSKKRLDLLYGNNYQLQVFDNVNEYQINLTLPL